jgi:serine/threonine protein kinase
MQNASAGSSAEPAGVVQGRVERRVYNSPRRMPFAAGTRIGSYEITSPLGAGGMGEVYRARDTRLDRAVAIKVLPAALARDPALRERFEREARAISSLQ